MQVDNDVAVSGKSAEFTVWDEDSVSVLVVNAQSPPIITFCANGGVGTMGDQSFTYDVPQNLTKNTFTRDGYSFSGWNTESNGSGVLYVDEYKVSFTSSTTLYAQWIANTYTVKFNVNGGVGTMADQPFTYDVPQNLFKNTFTRDGYSFSGWNTESNGIGIAYNDEKNVMNLSTGNPVTLYAQWTINQYTITFENTGDSTIAPIIQDYGTAVTAPAAPTRTGYTFDGWDKEIPETMPAVDTTITAKWKENSNGHHGEADSDSSGSSGTSGSATDTGSGNYSEYLRTTENGGEVGFGTSPVVIKVILPEETTGSVTLITNPETPKTGDADVYYDFALDIPNYPENEDGKVIWRIPTSLLDEEFGADDYGVRIFEDGEWKPLDSVWEENGTYHIYTTGISSDGNFIIVKEKGAAEKRTDETPVVKPEGPPKEEPSDSGEILPPISGDSKPDDKEEEEPKVPVLGIGIGLLILILVIIGIVFTVSRRK